ncbi:MAG: mucoidy inhibitor MuiA family protein [Marinifilaceae bacterium]
MNRILLLVALMFSGLFQVSAEAKPIESNIKEVTVFLKGAQVTRYGEVMLPAGTTELRFYGLSDVIDPRSVQLNVNNGVTVLSVMHQKNYLDETKGKEVVEAFEQRVQRLKDEIEAIKKQKDVYREEKMLLLANRNLAGKEGGVSVLELQKAAEFFRARLTEIYKKVQALDLEEREKGKEIRKINQQFLNLRMNDDRPTSEVLVKLQCKKAMNAKLKLNYFVTRASWSPSYDLRVEDINQPLLLNYKARVLQNTGIDWKDVKITLSSGNPNLGGVRPELRPWRLRGILPPPHPASQVLDVLNIVDNEEVIEDELEIEDSEADQDEEIELCEVVKIKDSPQHRYRGPQVQISNNATQVEFVVEQAYSIPSDGKGYMVELTKMDVAADYRYFCAPKLDRDAFLTAQVPNWEDYQLLDGGASIYFEGTYVGRTYINTAQIGDTLNVSLGRDKNVVITREKVKSNEGNQFLGSYRKEMRDWEISVRNKKQQPIQITIEDQYPLSVQKSLSVELRNQGGAKNDELNGKLEWNLDLKPAETQRLGFSYLVKYPKGEIIYLE